MTTMPPSGSNLRGAVDLSSLVNSADPAAAQGSAVAPGTPPAPGATVPVPSLVLEGTDANFGEILELSNTVPVLVDLWACLLYTSDAADDLLCVDLGGRRIIKKKKKKKI